MQSTPAPDRSPYMTVQEVAAYLRVGDATVINLITARKLKALFVGRKWRIHRGDLNDWIYEAQEGHQ